MSDAEKLALLKARMASLGVGSNSNLSALVSPRGSSLGGSGLSNAPVGENKDVTLPAAVSNANPPAESSLKAPSCPIPVQSQKEESHASLPETCMSKSLPSENDAAPSSPEVNDDDFESTVSKVSDVLEEDKVRLMQFEDELRLLEEQEELLRAEELELERLASHASDDESTGSSSSLGESPRLRVLRSSSVSSDGNSTATPPPPPSIHRSVSEGPILTSGDGSTPLPPPKPHRKKSISTKVSSATPASATSPPSTPTREKEGRERRRKKSGLTATEAKTMDESLLLGMTKKNSAPEITKKKSKRDLTSPAVAAAERAVSSSAASPEKKPKPEVPKRKKPPVPFATSNSNSSLGDSNPGSKPRAMSKDSGSIVATHKLLNANFMLDTSMKTLSQSQIYLEGTQTSLNILESWSNKSAGSGQGGSAALSGVIAYYTRKRKAYLFEKKKSRVLNSSPNLATNTSGQQSSRPRGGSNVGLSQKSPDSPLDPRRAIVSEDKRKRRNSIRTMIRNKAKRDSSSSSGAVAEEKGTNNALPNPQTIAEGLLSGESINSSEILNTVRRTINHATPDWTDSFVQYSGVSALFKVFQRAQGTSEIHTVELMKIASECICSLLVSNEKAANVILSPPLLVQAVKLMQSGKPGYIQVGCDLLLSAAQVPRRGSKVVVEAFALFSQNDEEVFRPVVDGLTTITSTVSHQSVALQLLNTILLQNADAQDRYRRLNQLLTGGALPAILYLMDNVEADKALSQQVMLFKDMLKEDHGESERVLKTKPISIICPYTKDPSSLITFSDFFQIFMPYTLLSDSVIIPYKGKKTTASVLETAIACSHHFTGHMGQSTDLGLYIVQCGSCPDLVNTWLKVKNDDGTPVKIQDLRLLGKVVLQLKMLPWILYVKVPGGKSLRVNVEPEWTMSDLSAFLVKRCDPGTIDDLLEYGIYAEHEKKFCSSDDQIYASGLETLDNHWLELKCKPHTFRVAYKERFWDIDVSQEDNYTVRKLYNKVTARMNLPKDETGMFGLFYEIQGEEELQSTQIDLDEDIKNVLARVKNDTRIFLRVKEKPIAVKVVMPSTIQAKSETYQLSLGTPLSQSLAYICKIEDLDPTGHHLCKLNADGTSSPLFPWVSAREQDIDENTVLTLVVKEENETHNEEQGNNVNIWEDSDTEENLKKQVVGDSVKISAGSLNALIRHLTNIENHDNKFSKAFLATYRTFTTPQTLWNKLVERYRCPPNTEEAIVTKVHIRVLIVLKQWVQMFNEDSERKLIGDISDFLEKEGKGVSECKIAEDVKRTIAKRKNENKSYHFNQDPPPVMLPKPPQSLVDLHPLEIARQWTLYEFEYFSKIKPIELFKQAWSKPKLQHLCPNVMGMINHFNDVSRVVSSAICNERKVQKRAKVYELFVLAAHHLASDLNSYNLVVAVISGLNNSAVLRLKWTKERISKRAQQMQEELEALTNMENSYKNYRERVTQSQPPIVPYMGVYLADLTFIEDGNPDMLNGCINFEKRLMEYKILEQIETLQVDAYNLSKSPEVVKVLSEVPLLDDKEMYARSLEIEPRNAARTEIE